MPGEARRHVRAERGAGVRVTRVAPRRVGLGATLASALALAACGGSEAPRLALDATVLPGDQVFSTLTYDQGLSFCASAEVFVAEVYTDEMTIRTACLADAVRAGVDGGLAACEANLATCIANAAPLPPVDLTCPSRAAAGYPECPATTAEIVACADAAARAAVELLWTLDCDTSLALLGQSDPGLVFEEARYALEDGPCANVAIVCPTFYEGLLLAEANARSFIP